jgi:hypothetical protein
MSFAGAAQRRAARSNPVNVTGRSTSRPNGARASADRRRRVSTRSTARTMAARVRRRKRAAMPYRYMIVGEDGLGSELLGGLAALLCTTLDEGERYSERAWRTLRPAFRVVALAGDGAPVGQASCFWLPCQPACRLLGLGDVAVAPAHRRRQVARTACTLATAEAWRLHADAILAKTRLLRTVLATTS